MVEGYAFPLPVAMFTEKAAKWLQSQMHQSHEPDHMQERSNELIFLISSLYP